MHEKDHLVSNPLAATAHTAGSCRRQGQSGVLQRYYMASQEHVLNNPSPKLLLTLSIAGLLLAVGLAGLLVDREVAPAGKKAAPDFSLALLDGGHFSLSAQKGRPVLLNFFASWCMPCREEVPALVKIQKEYEAKGISFVAIAVDDTEKDVREFVSRLGFSFLICHDEKGDVKQAFGVYGLPTTFFIDKEGMINYVHPGSVNETLLRHELDQLL